MPQRAEDSADVGADDVTLVCQLSGRPGEFVVLKEGRVEAEGTLDDLLASCAEMRALWHDADDPDGLV